MLEQSCATRFSHDSGAEVVDLAKHWPEMLRDRPSALAAHGRKGILNCNVFSEINDFNVIL